MAMSTAIDAAIDEVKPVTMEVIAQHEASGDDDGTKQIIITAAAESIIKPLAGKKLATEKVWINIRQMGTHVQNRFGVGLEVTNVHDLLQVILQGGFRYDKCAGAIGFEMVPPSGMARCVALSAKGTMQEILDDRGYTARDKEAGNAKDGANRQHSKMRTLLQIHRCATQHLKTFGEIRWPIIERQIEKTRPHLRGQVGDMCLFVSAYSGGEDGCLRELHAVGDCRRDAHGSTFAMLARLKCIQGPEYMTSCIKACSRASDSHCRDGVAKLLNGTGMAAIKGSKKFDVSAFLAITAAAKSFLSNLANVTPSAKAKVLGRMQVRCVLLIHSKQSRGNKKYQNLGDIKHKFLEEVDALCPGATSEGPWAKSETLEASSGSAPSAVARGLVQINATFEGMVLADSALRAKGKKRKADDDDDGRIVIDSSELAGEYQAGL
ncbi:unnamed protein product [Prorocentrum cordatum]|uniref:Uncharacterized protein n=1 Tax=Prorocentrum cordatum TaxID=2364126 RepID=A0ABN9QTR0_9DINO|nr:unnamed protein product [Polarella glacialis]